MPTIHLVYPHGPRISCPDAIGRNLGQRLEEKYPVVYHAWDRPEVIRPDSGDVLMGHANPSPFTCFRMSLKQAGWKRILLMLPYTHGDPRYNAFIDPFIERCDLFLTITGNYWFNDIRNSPFAHWLPKMRHVDLAVDRQDFPVIKTQFNPPGQRRFVFIGKSASTKNTVYLSQIADQSTTVHSQIGWIGGGRPVRGLMPYGYMDFSTPAGQALVKQFDFMITVSRADANPATILEAMAWGLIPVCTPQSGYVGYPGIVNVPLDDLREVMNIMNRLQEAAESELIEMQSANWQVLDDHFNWDRFAQQVIQAIESIEVPPIDPISLQQRLWLRWLELLAPYAIWKRPRHLARVLGYFITNKASRQD